MGESAQRYFAIVVRNRKQMTGYVLDYYPEERASYEREEYKNIVGDFSSPSEAMDKILDVFKEGYE